MKNQPKVAVFILHFGSSVETFLCLESVLKLNYDNFDVVLIGNDPSQTLKKDFSLKYNKGNNFDDYLDLKDKKVFIIETGQNLGFSGGFNYGIKKYKQNNQLDYAWLLNNDLTVDIKSLNNLVTQSYGSKNLAMLGSIVQEKLTSRSYFGSSLDLVTGNTAKLVYENRNQQQIDKEISQIVHFTIDGSAIFLKLSVLESDFKLPTRYFLFFEELYLAQKIKQKNLKVGVCINSLVNHTGSVGTDKISRNKIYYIFRNRVAFYKEFYPQFLFFILFYQFTRIGLGFLFKRKFKEMFWLLEGAKDGILFKNI